jgi:phosphate transport system permease protein
MKTPQPTDVTAAAISSTHMWNWRHAISPTGNTSDAIFRASLFFCAFTVCLIIVAIIIALISRSIPTFEKFGLEFLISKEWNPIKGSFGALPFIYGTITSSIIALLISVPLSLGVAIFLVEQAPYRIARPVTFLVELLAAIPSVVYGLWGIFVLAPFLRENVNPILMKLFGFLPLFQGTNTGIGLLTGGIILSIMITPIITAVVRDVLAVVPMSQREAALALGATKWETTLVVLANGAAGIAGAIILGLGRAIGETMAVTMVIGNRAEISASLFDPSYTIASVIANELAEATDELHSSALIEIGLILFLVTFIINAIARILVWSVSRKTSGGARAA